MDYLDVCVLHPFTNDVRMAAAGRRAQCMLDTVVSRKFKRNAAMLDGLRDGSELIIIAVSTLGGCYPAVRDYFREVAHTVASAAQIPLSRAVSTLFQRFAARLVQRNVHCLYEGLELLHDDAPNDSASATSERT